MTSAGASEFAPVAVLSEDVAHGFREHLHIARRHEPAAFIARSDGGICGADVRCDHRQTVCHGVEPGLAEAFGKGRLHPNVGLFLYDIEDATFGMTWVAMTNGLSMRSSRGSAEVSMWTIAPATAGCTASIESCIAWATAR